MSNVITDPKMRAFVDSPVSKEFGLSISQVANKVKGYGRFKSWLGGDVNKIEQVLEIVKANGISPTFFGAYERTEGYNSQWGWLNHTRQKGDYFEDADSVSKVVKTASNDMSSKPSWIDYGHPVDFVPESVKTAGNEHFSNLPKGTIGRAFIPLTAAGAWQVYYPNGLKKEYNKVQDYGAPLSIMINAIEEWGGVIGSSGGGTDPVDPDPEIPVDPEPEPEAEPEEPDVPVDEIFNQLLYEKSEVLIGNRFFNVEKLYNNMFKLKPTKLFYDTVIIEGIEEYPYDEEEEPIDPNVPDPVDPDPIDPETPVEPSGDPVFPTVKGLRITSKYGYRGDIGVPGASKYHWAIDIGGGGKTHPIYATQDGVVTHSGTYNSGGVYIIIKHTGDKYYSRYLHLVNNSAVVNIGQTVKKGQKIATMGNTGISGGIHLDFAISTNGTFGTEADTIDPEVYLGIKD